MRGGAVVRRRALIIGPLLLLLPSAAAAQEPTPWPVRPVRILLAYPPGGSTDVLARALADRLSAAFPGPGFVVENRPGGAAVVGTQAAATAAPDGYTLRARVRGIPARRGRALAGAGRADGHTARELNAINGPWGRRPWWR
jgi:tripartite-type tricarboxylate transporter receptor subunit TctC